MLKLSLVALVIAAAAPNACEPEQGPYPGAPVSGVATRCVPPADVITWYGTLVGDVPNCPIHQRITSDTTGREWNLSDPAKCEYVSYVDGEEQLLLNQQKLVALEEGNWWCGPYQNTVTLDVQGTSCPYSFAPCVR
jgi:hypothetical protein